VSCSNSGHDMVSVRAVTNLRGNENSSVKFGLMMQGDIESGGICQGQTWLSEVDEAAGLVSSGVRVLLGAQQRATASSDVTAQGLGCQRKEMRSRVALSRIHSMLACGFAANGWARAAMTTMSHLPPHHPEAAHDRPRM
jgi:hypothetical protein